MKAFLYTLVLVAVLIAALIFLQSLPQPGKPARVGREVPMVVQSEPAPLVAVEEDAAAMNREALYETGVELLDLWHVREAVGVLEAAVEADSTFFEAYLKLVECYADPTLVMESEARRCLRKARETATRANSDTLWVSAVGNLYLHGNPAAAVDALKALDKTRVRNDEVLLQLGRAYLALGDLAQAERHVGDLLDRDPSLSRAKELMIRVKAEGGDLGEAERLSRDLAATYPEEPYPYVILSQILLAGEKTAEAAEFANNALRIDARYIPAIVANAHVDAAAGELEAARVGFEKLLLFDRPMLSAFAMEGIATVEFLSGRFEQGARDMDDAIRLSMSAGSMMAGLEYAFRLIDCLCDLQRPDMAETVLERWVAHFGEIPARLAQLRIHIARGNASDVRLGLERIRNAPDWRRWMRLLDVDFTSIYALALIQEKDFSGAVALIDAADPSGYAAGRRAYLTAYAHFEMGGAEKAAELLAAARSRSRELEFPYHGDPVMVVQSMFFSAEAALARGEGPEAERFYREFLDLWGGADWELQAVGRARGKLDTLTSNVPSVDQP